MGQRVGMVFALLLFLSPPLLVGAEEVGTDPATIAGALPALLDSLPELPADGSGVDLLRDAKLSLSREGFHREQTVVSLVGHDADAMATRELELPKPEQLATLHAWWARVDSGAVAEVRMLSSSSWREMVHSGGTTVVIGYPGLRPGDIVGHTVQVGGEGVLERPVLLLSGPRPARRSLATVTHTGKMFYLVEAAGQGTWRIGHESRRVWGEERGKLEFIHRFSLDRVAPQPAGALAPPPLLVSPRIEVRLAAYISRGSVQGAMHRLYNWNQLAFYLALNLEQVVKEAPGLPEAAWEVAANRPTLAMIETDLVRHVRDEVRTVPSGLELAGEEWDLAAILEQGEANSEEKAMLLVGLLRTFAADATLGLVRSRDLGPVDRDSPSPSQFDAVVVAVGRGEERRWHDPGCETCRPGVVRPALQGGHVLVPTVDLGEAEELLTDDYLLRALEGDDVEFFLQEFLGDRDWHEWTTLPDGEGGVGRAVHERLLWSPDLEQAQLELVLRGHDPLRQGHRDGAAPEELLESFLSAHHPHASLVSVGTGEAPGEDQLPLVAQLDYPPAMEAGGDDWWLEPSRLLGAPVVPPSFNPVAYYHPSGLHWRTVATVPLPRDWSDVVLPGPVELEGGRVSYALRWSREGGQLRLERSLHLPPGLIEPAFAVDAIRDVFAGIRAAEAAPVVLLREGEG